MRKARKTKFPDIDRSTDARKGKKMGWLNFQPLHVGRWQWPDQVIFWTWRDAQREFFESKKRKRRGKQVIVFAGLMMVIAVIRWAFI